jgi:uncharacterized protein (DUF2062 family)
MLIDVSSSHQLPAPQNFFQRRLITPVFALLRMGATPRRIAWSLAIGLVIGVNPMLGSTTILALAAAAIFRLNLVASQIANHVVYPLQLVLFFLFIRGGDYLFHTGKLPLHRKALIQSIRRHPWDTTRLLWSWEWHAFTVWIIFAVVTAPLVAEMLTPLLGRVVRTDHSEVYPEVEGK